ncbi:hypothetical protein [Planctomyces sp. SH-PL14]|jgi:hypothetical protein|uniref:hypothetical protein n=1 Tax=Planctomyces sp. SH-PL14 TaxID=1632864 RepID=UPI00078D9905|nr:hypothetical protein [Planctomyces sp. SH-PL14]AMV19402.1 hypothetical protein VT03_16030 [Planctomyces sp. SH-PL14]
MSRFQVRIHSLPEQPGDWLPALSHMVTCPPTAAWELADYVAAHVPCLLVAGVEEAVATRLVDALTQAGASAEAELSPTSFPMLLCPGLDAAPR